MGFIDRLRLRLTYESTTKDRGPESANFQEIERFGSRILGPFRTYPVEWTGSTTDPAIENGTLEGCWREFGDLVWVRIEMTAGSSTTFGSGFHSFSLPFPSHFTWAQTIPGEINSSTAGRRWTLAGHIPADSSTINRVHYDGGSLTGTAPVTLASGDSIILQGFYIPG